MPTIYAALKTVLAERRHRFIAGIGFVSFLAVFLLTVPSAYIGGYISLDTSPYLTTRMIVVSAIMASLVSMILSLMAFLYARRRATTKTSTVGGLLVGIATPVPCCPPLLPILLGFVAIFPLTGQCDCLASAMVYRDARN